MKQLIYVHISDREEMKFSFKISFSILIYPPQVKI